MNSMKHINRGCNVLISPLSLLEAFAGVAARVESLLGRMFQAGRQVEGLSSEGDAARFEAMLSEGFEQWPPSQPSPISKCGNRGRGRRIAITIYSPFP